jgi:hypothetical protein
MSSIVFQDVRMTAAIMVQRRSKQSLQGIIPEIQVLCGRKVGYFFG